MEAAGCFSIRGVAITATGVDAAATGTQARAAPTGAMRALQATPNKARTLQESQAQLKIDARRPGVAAWAGVAGHDLT